MRKITKIGNNMITLQEAINLAAEAHEGQWRKAQPTTTADFNQINDTTKVSPISDKHFILDDSTNIYIETTNFFGKPLMEGGFIKKAIHYTPISSNGYDGH